MHRYTQAVLACSLAVVMVCALAVPVAGQTGDGDGEGVLDTITGDADGVVDKALAAADFLYGLGQGYAADLISDDDADYDAFQVALDLRNDLNGHSDAYQSYLNARSTPSETRDVLQVTVEGPDSNDSTFYVTANVVNGTYENFGATGSTNRTVDESCTLSGRAAANADDELTTFREEFVEPNETVDRAYMGRLAAEYDGIECSFTNGSES